MFRIHYKSLVTALSIFVAILVAIGLTLMAGYLAGITPDRPSPEVIVPLDKGAVQAAQLPPVEEPRVKTSNSPELFFIRAEGARGPLVAYDMANSREQFRLPAGMPSADGQIYYAATVEQGETRLAAFIPESGALKQSFSLPGQWSLSGVSPTGRWLALTRLPSEPEKAAWREAGRWQTEIAIIEGSNGQVRHSMQLEGNFEVETISAGGDSLFLIEHVPAIQPTQYLVRLYDLAAEQLQPGALRAKTATDELMTGLAWGGVASADGQWLLTLYLNTDKNTAFIHTLNLENKIPFCIDLPSGEGRLEQLKAYTLALSPDGQTIYTANAALGVVAEVSLTELRVVRQVTFPASALPAPEAETEVGPTNYSMTTKDGQKLYFSAGREVWAYEPATGQVRGSYWRGEPIRGLGLSRDEQQLYLAVVGQAPVIIDIAAQEALSYQAD